MKRHLLGNVRRRMVVSWSVVNLSFVAAWTFGVPLPAAAQMVMDGVDQLQFDRPESWALKYFTTVSLVSGLEAPRTRKPGSLVIGLEFGSLPPLTNAEQLVGYNGTEPQDLNKAPFVLRPRVTVALPAGLALVVAVVPPVRMFGIKPMLLAVALERPLYETGSWAVGLRAYGQVGRVEGSYTCPEAQLAFAPGSAGNADGCQAASSDVAMLRYVGGEASLAYRPEATRGISPHAAFGITFMDVAFQVNALTFGMIDHTRYLSDGVTASVSGGVSYWLTNRLGLSVDVFYAPLSVTPQFGAPTRIDGLFNVRALATYRLH